MDEDLFEEWLIVVEVESDVELGLEVLPDVARLGLGHLQLKFVGQFFIKTVTRLFVLAEEVNSKVRFLGLASVKNALSVLAEFLRALGDKEFVLLFRVVDVVEVGEVDEVLAITGAGDMGVMYGRLRHLVEALVQFRFPKDVKVLIVGLLHEERVVFMHAFSQFAELGASGLILLSAVELNTISFVTEHIIFHL